MTWLFLLLEQMSPAIVKSFRAGMDELLVKLANEALKTENTWDDWGVLMIRKILKIEKNG